MNILRKICTGLLGCVALLPQICAASGATPAQVVNSVGGPLVVIGGGTVSGVAVFIATKFIPIGTAVAILVVVIAGAQMALSQDENEANRMRLTFIGGVVGVVLLQMTPVLASIVTGGSNIVTSPGATGSSLTLEFQSFIEWASMALGSVAILMIVIGGIRAVANLGSGEGIAQLRRTVFGVVGGITLIAFYKVLIVNPLTVQFSPNGFIAQLILFISDLLGYLGIVAVAVVILAGLYMILNVGNDEQYTKARNLIIRLGIGIIVILSSWAIINIIFVGATS